jgi:hypothetical protein
LTVSGFFLPALSAVGWPLDNLPGFPEFCGKSEKWFRRPKNCFVAAGLMKQIPSKYQRFQYITDLARHPGSMTHFSRGRPLVPSLARPA